MGTPNSTPKIKELGFLELKIITVLLDLVGCPLESSMWAFVLRVADGEFEEGIINEGETPPTSPHPHFLEFGCHFSHKFLVLVQNCPKNMHKHSLDYMAK